MAEFSEDYGGKCAASNAQDVVVMDQRPVRTLPLHYGIAIFTASWCSSCKALINKIASELPEIHALVTKIDVDDCPDLADEYGVAALPLSIFFRSYISEIKLAGSDFVSFLDKYQIWSSGLTPGESVPSELDSACEPVIPSISYLDHGRFNAALCQKFTAVHSNQEINLEFLKSVGLDEILWKEEDFCGLNCLVSECGVADSSKGPHIETEKLFTYRIPTVSKDGTCSNVTKLAARAFNLACDAYSVPQSDYDHISLSDHPIGRRLRFLNRVVDSLHHLTSADWIGIYRVVSISDIPLKGLSESTNPIESIALLKEAYYGEPSRPIFPLTSEFAAKSTNSWVGLTGNARIIANTRQRQEGVSYYECSGKVQSELCVPILRKIQANIVDSCGDENNSQVQWQVIGIIDLESWSVDHFSPRMVLEVLKVAMDLGEINLQCDLESAWWS